VSIGGVMLLVMLPESRRKLDTTALSAIVALPGPSGQKALTSAAQRAELPAKAAKSYGES
jgi:hypothetical protein